MKLRTKGLLLALLFSSFYGAYSLGAHPAQHIEFLKRDREQAGRDIRGLEKTSEVERRLLPTLTGRERQEAQCRIDTNPIVIQRLKEQVKDIDRLIAQKTSSAESSQSGFVGKSLGFVGSSLGAMITNPDKTVLGAAGLMVLHGMYLKRTDISRKVQEVYSGHNRWINGLSLAYDVLARGPRASFITLVNAKNDFAKWRSDTWDWFFNVKKKHDLGSVDNPQARVTMSVIEYQAKLAAEKKRAAEQRLP